MTATKKSVEVGAERQVDLEVDRIERNQEDRGEESREQPRQGSAGPRPGILHRRRAASGCSLPPPQCARSRRVPGGSVLRRPKRRFGPSRALRLDRRAPSRRPRAIPARSSAPESGACTSRPARRRRRATRSGGSPPCSPPHRSPARAAGSRLGVGSGVPVGLDRADYVGAKCRRRRSPPALRLGFGRGLGEHRDDRQFGLFSNLKR